jgi:hypothetical protein
MTKREKSRIEEESSITSTTSTSISLIPWEITEATEGTPKGFKCMILKLRNQDNALIIAKFILSMKNINLSDSYRKSLLIIADMERKCITTNPHTCYFGFPTQG